MAGLNRASALISESTKIYRKSIGIKCIFLSHQKADKDICKQIANYLIAADIDVYFDEYDHDLKIALQENNPYKVTQAICNGINNSSHMLCIISPNTINSRWVPFEVGYGYDKTYLGILTLKGISDNLLPDYIKTAKVVIRGTKSLNDFISKTVIGTSSALMESRNLIKSHSSTNHPLDNYLDWGL